ncbi:protein giant [Malaya genurostris]|uniref:protein giant n=1 Tax=Malaya genurostris TaxID=325434 RepID=UPI0026F3FF9F|nr:protein giant [Malaya genurostris]
MAQFMMDLKAEHRTSPSLYPPISPKMLEIYRPDSTDSGVLDLSKRRDSVDTRKTPSPYDSFSEAGSPPLQSSPINSTNQLLMSYHAIHHQQRDLPPKTKIPYESPNHLEQGNSLAARFNPTQGYPIAHPVLPKQENFPHRPEMMPYLFQSGAIQHQPFHRSPLQQTRETDSLSESGSEGQILAPNLKLTQLKQSPDQTTNSPVANGTYPMVIGRDGKLTRPFKAYPRDPLSLTAGFMASDSLLDTMSAEKYNIFRKRMLEHIRAANGGQPTVCNPKMRRLNKSLSDASETESVPDKMSENNELPQSQQATPSEGSNPSETANGNSSNGANGAVKDAAYYERRKKNNAAAKKSRDRRRIKEDEITIRAHFLENENMQLRCELAAARKQLALYGVTTVSP